MSVKRLYYRLSQAAEILGCAVDDLVHLAANRQTRLGIVWEADSFYPQSVIHPIDLDSDGQPKQIDNYQGFVYIDCGYLVEAERTGRFTCTAVELPDGRVVSLTALHEEGLGHIHASVEELFIHQNELAALQKLVDGGPDADVTPSTEWDSKTDQDAVDPNEYNKKCADLFDPVTVAFLETLFPADNRWAKWSERAARNGLIDARNGRGTFNPYLAGLWFLRQGIAGWDHARVMRRLTRNLPARSRDQADLLTGEPE
jgi:hypothetical protein